MFRPNLALPADADALLVRGRLNTDGRLEQLAILAPTEWAQKDSLFHALAQWRFRPAMKDGQPVAVEVLLVIRAGGRIAWLSICADAAARRDVRLCRLLHQRHRFG